MGEKTRDKVNKNLQFKREFSAGGVVFKKGKKGLKFLIIKPAETQRWQFPKGLVEKDETQKNAAIREVEEEGGVKVRISEKLGSSNYFYIFQGRRIFKTVTYFLMEYLKDSPKGHDQEVDEVKLVEYQKATKLLTFEDDRKILIKAKKSIEAGIQESLI